MKNTDIIDIINNQKSKAILNSVKECDIKIIL